MINLDYVNEEAQITISYMPDIQENTGMGIKALSQEEAIAYRYSYALNALIDTTADLLDLPGIKYYGREPCVAVPTEILHVLKHLAYTCAQVTRHGSYR